MLPGPAPYQPTYYPPVGSSTAGAQPHIASQPPQPPQPLRPPSTQRQQVQNDTAPPSRPKSVPELVRDKLDKMAVLQARQQLLTLLGRKEGDILVICRDEDWRIHSWIIPRHWNLYDKCSHWDKENHTIDMSQDDPDAIAIILKYAYTGDPELLSAKKISKTPFQTLVEVAIVAQKYGASELLERVHCELWALDVEAANKAPVDEAAALAEDALTALVRLRQCASMSKGLQLFQPIVLAFLRDCLQFRVMPASLRQLLYRCFEEDRWLAILIIKFAYRGDIESTDGLLTTTAGLQAPTPSPSR